MVGDIAATPDEPYDRDDDRDEEDEPEDSADDRERRLEREGDDDGRDERDDGEPADGRVREDAFHDPVMKARAASPAASAVAPANHSNRRAPDCGA